nr:wheat stem rust immune receptor [Thinopyrum obtusiflorum]
MVGIMVSASTGAMNSLLGKLTALMGEEFAKLKNMRKEVQFIRDELGSMKDALERLADVDELDPQTKSWRNTLREISYDIEDIIDDFMQNIGEKDKNSGFIHKTIRRLRTLRCRHRIVGQIQEIKKLVHETSGRRKRYALHTIIPPSNNDVAIDPRVITLYGMAANLVGMEGSKNELVNWLEDKDKQLKVVSIVGFGGLGKTTLANEVYHMLRPGSTFSAFVPVSQKPNILNLLRSLLSQLGIEPTIYACVSDLIDKLRERLQTKRYLIIIDDLWDVSAWNIIKCALPDNDCGSRVVVTTRIQEVATACCSHRRDYILQMKPLSDEDSKRLFYGRIFGSTEACPRHLRDVSLEVLKKCGGLPLAITSIASMLATEGFEQKERWKDVRNSLGSGTNGTLNGVRQILNLSYKDLPCYLKTCFLYLGMYPEDYTIKRSDLECQWMAEGFVSKENGHSVEKTARSYFNELVNRSLIQPVEFDNTGSVTQCRVHDMMLDLIMLKSVEENFLTVVDDTKDITGLDYKARRLSIRLDGASNDLTTLLNNISMSHVRSVMFFGSSQNTPPLSKFKFLRVLFINLHRATIDLTGLCKLYQLRYLWISDTCHYQVPTRIRELQHLETLNVKRGLPDGIGNMKSLRYLRAFDLRLNTLDNIKSLGELTNLRCLFLEDRFSLSCRKKGMDALCFSLGRLCSLETLSVNLSECIDDLMLCFPPSTPYHLERLLVSSNCWFSKVPTWMGELCYLRELQCHLDEWLNDGVGILAELPALTDLDLVIQRLRHKKIVIYKKAFPALRRFELVLSDPSYLTFRAGAMPKLQRLKLTFECYEWGNHGVAPTGIGYLLALEDLSAVIICQTAEADTEWAESALRDAIARHPRCPRLQISSG